MWEFYIIETVDSLTSLLVGVLFGFIFLTVFYGIAYFYSYLDFFDDEKPTKRTLKFLKTSLTVTVILTLIVCVTPSKSFMYANLGVRETIKFIESDGEAKERSAKIIDAINKKLEDCKYE